MCLVYVNPLQLDLAVWSEIDQILSKWRKGITTSKAWIGEAQGEIKGSLEEVGEGDQTAVVVATLDRPVNSRPAAIQVAAIWVISLSGCQILRISHVDLEEDRVMRAWGRGAEGGKEMIHRMSEFSVVRSSWSVDPSLVLLPPYTFYVKGNDNYDHISMCCTFLKTEKSLKNQ